MRPDLTVVPHVHQIVQFHAFRDAGVVERTAIDRGVRSDFHVIANLHDPHLGKLPVLPLTKRVTETLRSNHRA